MSASTPNRSIEKFVRMLKAQYSLPGTGGSTKWTGTPAIIVVVGILVGAMLFAIYQSRAQADPTTTVVTVQKKADTEAARAELVRPPASSPAPVARNNEAGGKAAKTEKSEQTPERVTITGCLERSDETFRLTDTSGEDAPTSRSWKSGFLKKRKARLEVVDSVKRLNLASHVGERVSVTGTLVEKEIHAGSLQRLAASCDKA